MQGRRLGGTRGPPALGGIWGEVGSDSASEIPGGPPADDCLPVEEPCGRKCLPSKRRGALGATGELAHGTSDRVTTAQESYDAKMYYAKTTREIDISKNSLSVVTRTSYRLIMRRWADFWEGEERPFG